MGLSSLFGSSKATNKEIVAWQKKEAEEAAARAEELKARRADATAQINQIYGGIGDDFYEAYRKSILDYYTPQLMDRYRDAQSQTMFKNARQGIRQSSAHADAQADLSKGAQLQYADLYGSADDQTRSLRDKITAEKFGALNLAASAEDPSMAVDRALTEVNAAQVQPRPSALGDIFGAAAIGYQSYQDQRNRQNYYNQISQAQPYKTNFTGSGSVIGR